MASIERRNGRYRVKYRDPSNRQRSRTFTRKADADRFLVEIEADLARGQWLDPAGARISVAEWAETFLSLCRRLERTSQDTYERDLRHTSVALAIAGGAHPKAILTRMGHSSIRVTLDRCGHLLPELDQVRPVLRRRADEGEEAATRRRGRSAIHQVQRRFPASSR